MKKLFLSLSVFLAIGILFFSSDFLNQTKNTQTVGNDHHMTTGSSGNTLTQNETNKTLKPLNSNMDTSSDSVKSAIERIKSITHKNALQQHLVNEHDEFKRYPEFNKKFSNPAQDPTRMRHTIDQRSTTNPDTYMAMTLWSDQKYYLKNDTVNIFLTLQDADGQLLASNFKASLMQDGQGTLHNFEFQSFGDIQASQQPVFSMDLHSISHTLKPGIYKIYIQNAQHELQDSITFTLSQPDIELTGEYKDYINDKGDLIIEAQVSVSSDNRYYLQASLYNDNDQAVGASQLASELQTGTHWLPLLFDGLMIQDSQAAGPYTLKHLSLAKVTMPMNRAPLVSGQYFTQAYALDEFQ